MKTAIVINLDYQPASHDLCEAIWEEIRETLLANGFLLSGRMFTHSQAPEYALPLARTLIESMEAHLDYHERRYHRYIKEFYGFRCEQITDLLTPCARDIKVNFGA